MSKEQVGDYLVDKETGQREYHPEGNPERQRTVRRGGITETQYLNPHAYDEHGRDYFPDT